MHSNFVFILVCCSILFIAKGDEKPEEWRLKVEEGTNGTCSRKFKVETLQETCKDFCKSLGTRENPDTSCNTALSDTWIFRPKPFRVSCKDKREICVDIPNTDSMTVKDLNNRSTIVKKEDWLWPANTDYKDFYGYEKSQISHLVSISNEVTMELMLYCNNFELKDNIQIQLWNNTRVVQNPTATSNVTYTVLEDVNSCKNLEANKWASAIITLKTFSTAVKNFYVKPYVKSEEPTTEQKIYIQLKKLCFNF